MVGPTALPPFLPPLPWAAWTLGRERQEGAQQRHAQAEQLQEQLSQTSEYFTQFSLVIFCLPLVFAPNPISPSGSWLFIPFGPLLLLPHLSSPGWANLSCSHPLHSLPTACPAYFEHEPPITQTATQHLAHWGTFSGAAVITTAESHGSYIFTSLYRNIQWCFTRLLKHI